MANTNTPHGLVPVRYLSGKPYNGARRPYYVPATYATDLFIYDPVVLAAGGANAAAVRDHAAATLPIITKAVAGPTNRITGVIVAFEPVANDVPLLYGAASTERIAWVADDPDLVFRIRDDGYSVLGAADVSENAALIQIASGSTETGISGVGLDAGTTTAPSATANGQLTILGLDTTLPNEPGQYANWLVRINLHSYAYGVAGVE